MKHLLFASCLVGALAVGGVAEAQTFSTDPMVAPKAGSLMVRLRAIGVIPEDNGSSTSVGGKVQTTAQPAPEADLSYYFTDHIAAEVIAATTRHSLAAVGTAVGRVPVGSVWVLPPTVTVQYHFMPNEIFSPYVGVGLNLSLFYDASAAKPTVTSFKVDNQVAPALQVGFDYSLGGPWFANVDVKQIFFTTKAHLKTVLGPVSAKTGLDPLVIGMGIGYRF